MQENFSQTQLEPANGDSEIAGGSLESDSVGNEKEDWQVIDELLILAGELDVRETDKMLDLREKVYNAYQASVDFGFKDLYTTYDSLLQAEIEKKRGTNLEYVRAQVGGILLQAVMYLQVEMSDEYFEAIANALQLVDNALPHTDLAQRIAAI